MTFVGLDFNTKYQAYLRFQTASYNILRQIESEKDERVKLKTKTQEFKKKKLIKKKLFVYL